MELDNLDKFYPESRTAWRNWLAENHAVKESVWLICYKKKTGVPTISWSEAVDEALCFGWIDSTRRTLDDDSFIQFFTRRKPSSTWSKINKDKVEKLESEGLMTDAGRKCIDIAKQNGSWSILDSVEELIVPDDLQTEFAKYPGTKDYYESLGKSVRKQILYWLVSAKRPETRQKRVEEIVLKASEGKKPGHIV